MSHHLPLAPGCLLSFQPCWVQQLKVPLLPHTGSWKTGRPSLRTFAECVAKYETEDCARWQRQGLVVHRSKHTTRKEASNIHRIYLSLKTFENRNETKLIKDATHPWPPQLLIGPKWTAPYPRCLTEERACPLRGEEVICTLVSMVF